MNENYEINAVEIPEGNELSKLIIKDYLDKNKDLKREEKIKIALKYQIFTEYTSLFAELELSEKLTEEMKKEIIGDEKTNIISKNIKNINLFEKRDYCCDRCCCCCCDDDCDDDDCDKDACDEGDDDIGFGDLCFDDDDRNYKANDYSENKKVCNKIEKEDEIEIKEENKKQEVKKDEEYGDNIEIKDIINEQNFVEGFWKINNKTEKIKEKYEKEFILLKEIKNKNINDNTAITILIIYFINKEHPELIDELLLIIQKAKKFIKEKAKDSYENIIKEIGL